MIRILNKQDEVVAVLSNDNGLEGCPYWDDQVHEKLNDSYATFEFKAPADHEYSEHLIEENKAAVNDFDGITRIFRIKIAEDVGEGEEKSRYIYGENEALELLGTIIKPQTFAGYTASQALDAILEGTRWQRGIVDWSGVRSPKFEDYVTAIEAIHTTRSLWDSDLRYRVTIDHNKVTGRYVDLPERVGEDNGKRFEYGKDLEGIKRTVSSETVYTAMYGVGKSNEDKTFATIGPAEWSTANGDPGDKPAGQEWIGDREALNRWGVEGRHIFGVYRNETIVDPELLLEYTWKALQKAKEPNVTFEATVKLLERLEGYGHERTRIGDTIRILDNSYAPPLLLEARVIEYVWSLSDPEKDKVVIGDYKPLLTNSYQILKDLQSAIRVNEGAWDAISKTYTGDTAPENPEPDTIWLDTSGEVDVYKRWDAAAGAWIPATPEDLATNQEITDLRDYIEKLNTNGLAMIMNASSFSTAGSNPGELYFHGFNENGDPADVDGFIIIDGVKQPIVKGMLNPNNHVSQGYIMYSTTENLFYLVLLNSAGQWIRYNAAPGAQHMTFFTPSPDHYFVGYVEMDGPENFTHAILWQQPRDYQEIVRLGVIPNIEQKADTAAADAAAAVETAGTAAADASTAKSTAETANTTAGQAKTAAETAESTANTANQTASTANQTATTANNTANAAKQAADNAWSKFSGVNNTLPAGNVEFNFAGSSSKGGNATNTDKVGTQTAATVQAVSINFNNRNDRKSTVPANPTIAVDGTAIDHVINKDSSANISFEWNFGSSGDAYDIDGFIIYVRQQAASTAYTFGSMPGDEQVFYVTPEKRAFIMYGVTADQYYTFGVQAYRQVDQDINSSGVLKSAIVKSTAAGENPYRPAATLAFAGTITGTINGKTPAEVTGQELAAKTAVQNGAVPLPTGALNGDINADQNAVISDLSNISFSRYGIEVADPDGGAARSSMTAAGFNAKKGAFTLEDEKTAQKYSLEVKQNLLYDHSFELLKAGTPATGAPGYHTISQESSNGSEDNYLRWWAIGAPYLMDVSNTDLPIMSPFGFKSVVVNPSNYIRQSVDVTPGRTFTASAHFFKPGSSTFFRTFGGGKIQLDFVIWIEATATLKTIQSSNAYLNAPPDGNYLSPQRIAVTATAPTPAEAYDAYFMRVTLIGSSGQADAWVEVDGVQLVEHDKPTQYEPENSLFAFQNGIGRPYVKYLDAGGQDAVLNSLRTHSMYYMEGQGEVAKIIGSDFAYFGFYPVGEFAGRKAWLGYGSATLAFKLFSYHDIQIQPNGGSGIFTFDQVTNGGLNFGQSKLKFTASSAALQSRNAADTAFGTFQASNVALSSKRDFKRLIRRSERKALELIEQTPVYEYKLEEEFNVYNPEDPTEKIGERAETEVKTRIGLLWEEAPEEIIEDEESISLYDMTAVMWKAIQEANLINKAQSLRLDNQKAEINELKQRLAALEQKVNNMLPPTT